VWSQSFLASNRCVAKITQSSEELQNLRCSGMELRFWGSWKSRGRPTARWKDDDDDDNNNNNSKMDLTNEFWAFKSLFL